MNDGLVIPMPDAGRTDAARVADSPGRHTVTMPPAGAGGWAQEAGNTAAVAR